MLTLLVNSESPQTPEEITIKTVFVSPEPPERENEAAHRYAVKKAKYHKPKNAVEAKNLCNRWAIYHARWFRKRGYSVHFGSTTIPFTGEK